MLRVLEFSALFTLFAAPGAGQGQTAPDPAAIVLPEGYTLADWALLAEDRLAAGEHLAVLADAADHLATHGRVAIVVEIEERALSELSDRMASEGDARTALVRIARIEQSGRESAALLRAKADAHRLTGDHSEAAAAYVEWLQAVPQSHPNRRDVLARLSQVRTAGMARADGERFAALLGRRYSTDRIEDSVGWTDLHFAAALNLPSVIGALVDARVPVDSPLKTGSPSPPFGDPLKDALRDSGLGDTFSSWAGDGETPLMIAAHMDSKDAADALLNRGADIALRNDEGGTALFYAAQQNAGATVELLLDRGAVVDSTRDDGTTPLHWAARADAGDTAEILLDGGADANRAADDGRTPLHWAARADAGDTAEILLDGGADANRAADDGQTPLHSAASGNARDTAELLLDRGAVLGAEETSGALALHYAAFFNAAEIAALLLDRGTAIHSPRTDGFTPLHDAARNNAHRTAELLLHRGADPNARTNYAETPLSLAVREASAEVTQLLLDRGAEVQTLVGGAVGPALLFGAVRMNHPEIADFLLLEGGDPNARDDNGHTLLHAAARANAIEAVRLLLDRGAAINAFSRANDEPQETDAATGNTALHEAAASNSGETLRLLLDRGADINRTDHYGTTPLYRAVENLADDAVQILIRADADVDTHDPIRDDEVPEIAWGLGTPLHAASRKDALQLARLLVTAGANVNAPDGDGWTPIHTAARSNSGEMITFLLSQGANVKAKTNDGETLLHSAAIGNAVELVRRLVQRGEDIHARNRYNATPLLQAADGSSIEAAAFLLSRGADIQTSNNNGWTPLHVAARDGDEAMTAFLINRGADLNATARDATPLQYAISSGRLKTTELLVRHGADVNHRDSDGRTPLHLAVTAFRNSTQLAQVLLDNGADINARTDGGRSPLQHALSADDPDPEVIALLRNRGARSSTRPPATTRNARPRGRRSGTASTPTGQPGPNTRSSSVGGPRCEIPGYPTPSNIESLGLSWCNTSVGLQRRAFALQAAGARCAIAGGSSSAPEQIRARHQEIRAACDALDALQRPGAPRCQCPASYRP